jgi:hypothetical protein
MEINRIQKAKKKFKDVDVSEDEVGRKCLTKGERIEKEDK